MKKIARLAAAFLLIAPPLFSSPVPPADSSGGRWVPAENIRRAAELFGELDDCAEERDSLSSRLRTSEEQGAACSQTKAGLLEQIKSLQAVASADSTIEVHHAAALSSERRAKRWLAILSGILLAALVLK